MIRVDSKSENIKQGQLELEVGTVLDRQVIFHIIGDFIRAPFLKAFSTGEQMVAGVSAKKEISLAKRVPGRLSLVYEESVHTLENFSVMFLSSDTGWDFQDPRV